jgi:multidrug efflux pump subunit AcrB
MKFPAFSTIIVFTCLMFLGLFLIPRLPVKLNPSRKIPVVNISFSMPGQSALVIEAEVTSKLEGMLSRMKGVKQISSHSSNGSGNITIRLSGHANPDMARFEISTIIRQAWPSLPQGVNYPSIYMSGAGEEEVRRPFLNYTVNAPFSPIQIQEYITDNLKPKITEIKGIDKVDVTGAGRMIYRLEYDYEQLQNLGVSIHDIRSSIQTCLTKEFLGIGKILDEDRNEQWIRMALIAENRNQPFDPAFIQVKNSTGTILYLDQLVKTTYEEERSSSSFRINGLNSIYLSITADETANQLNLSKQIQDLLSGYRDFLPAGYELHLQYDAGEYLREEMNKIYFRSGLTVLLLLCFVFLIYRNLKYSFLILFSLAANIAIAVIFYYLFHLEMQLYSLAGLTISLTLIIDNTIVMSDQILRRGNRKAFLAILTATLTSIGALTVILFMDEAVRSNLQDFAWVIIINLTVSLFIALFLVPALIEQFGIGKRRKKRSRKFFFQWRKMRGKRKIVYFNRGYEKIIGFMSRKRAWFIVVIVWAFGLPVHILPDKMEKKTERSFFAVLNGEELGYWAQLYNKTLGSTFYREKIKPVSDVVLGGSMRLFAQKVRNGSYSSGQRSETSLQVTASLPNGSTREQMDALIRKMENYIGQYPEVRQYETYINSGQRASISVLFVKKHQRSRFPFLLKSKVISRALELGGGSWSVYGLGDGFNNDLHEQAGSSRIKLLGYNYDELKEMTIAMRDSLLQHPRIKEVTIDSKFSGYKNDYTEYVFDLQKERLAQTNILPVDLFHSITPLFEKSVYAGDWVHEGRIEPVRLFAKQAGELDVWNLENYPGRAGGKAYKLSEIAGIEKWLAPQDIAKENQQYLLCLQYEYIGAYQQARRVMDDVCESFNRKAPLGYRAESEYSYYWWGRGNNYRQYFLLFLIVAVIYFMTSFLFNSMRQPLVVIFIIPVSFIGLFLTFYLFELNFDQGGFAAFILLAALSVNANIYVLNEYNNIRRRRPRIKMLKAYIKAWNAKISPIVLTIFSTILGFIPFMTGIYREAFWFPLAVGTIGGLVFSFLALFFFLPLFMGVSKTKGLSEKSLK